MYKILKKTIQSLIPSHLLFRFESPLRYFYYLFFIGNRFQCNICKKQIRCFITTENDKLCPRCGSLQRTRRLWHVIDTEFLNSKSQILDFSPSRCFYHLMKKKNIHYISSDLSGNFLSEKSYDLKAIDTENETFDLIICYHILEHIDDDMQAMKELLRVLKRGGFCLVQTPFKEGQIYENQNIKTPKEREIHFGQADHLRIYSVKGLTARLEHVGFIVETREFNETQENKHGFKTKETILMCKKK